MNIESNGIQIKEIRFIGDKNERFVNFNSNVCILNGASNTGKSFLVEVIDYMLGKESIDEITQAKEYQEIKLKITINREPFTIYRKFSDDKFEVYNGFVDSKKSSDFISYFKTGQPTKSVPNISDFFLEKLQLNDKLISSNLWAEKNKLTLRLLSRIIFSKEEKIISTHSPIEEGDRTEKTTNRNTFKFILTGIDDSNIKTVTRDSEFKSENKGRIHVLEEVIKQLKLALSLPDEEYDSLIEIDSRLLSEINIINARLAEAKKGLSELMLEREKLSKTIFEFTDRENDLTINQYNFEKLASIYIADIERLESQEEAAFLLTVGHNGECSVCGSSSELVCNDLIDINLLANASIAEIAKIEKKASELNFVIDSIKAQKYKISSEIDYLYHKLHMLDMNIAERTPTVNDDDETLVNLRSKKELIANDLFILSQISSLNKKLQESELFKAPKKYASNDFYPSTECIEYFCETYREILDEIEFPGDHSVSFDFKRFDVIVGGNPRHLNGKGVRAILNSVFKIALLKMSREKNTFHPGLVILDSPLVTYRDPMKSKHGGLEKDEEELAKSKISYRFLNYLVSLKDLAQFIIIENIDIPFDLNTSISIESFYGEGAHKNTRAGLF
ncbi:hypothetical protein ACEUAN_02905 [Aeromonas veronii]